MIRRRGPQTWRNVHLTHEARLDQLIDVDNSVEQGPQPRGFGLLRQAADDLDGLVREARDRGKRIRALGSGWALTDIAVTDGWLVNTKPLNGCFDVSERHFEPGYPDEKRPYLVVAQAGISVGELNVHLEGTASAGFRRSLKTSGIGAGQSIAGAVAGNTHGSAVNFGAMPDFVVGLQLVTGAGESLWIERASEPVLHDEFVDRLGARRIRDDDVFDAALVSFGAFGIITAVAIETSPIYQLKFPPVAELDHEDLKAKLDTFDHDDPPGLYHYEFIFNPYSRRNVAVEAKATKVDFEPGHEGPDPVWIIRSEEGFAPGDQTTNLFLQFPLLPPRLKAAIQFRQYRNRAILGDTRGTPGQVFTATITYLEGYTESALGVSIDDAAKTMEVSSRVIREMGIPAISQVRLVAPTRALLGFTRHEPRTAVFEFGVTHDAEFPTFERRLTGALTDAGVDWTLHWSKNSGIDPDRLTAMYGEERVRKWRAARERVFDGDTALMRVFDNEHLERAGLDAGA